MRKEITAINKNNKLILSRAKNLLNISNKILNRTKDEFEYKLSESEKIDNEILDNIIKWAKENNIYYYEFRFNLDGLIKGLLEKIDNKIFTDINSQLTNDGMFFQRVRHVLASNIKNIYEIKEFEIDLPFATMIKNEPYHFQFTVTKKLLTGLVDSNQTAKVIPHGIPLNKQELLKLTYLNLEWIGILVSSEIFNLKNIKKLNLKCCILSRNEIENDWSILSKITKLNQLEELYIGCTLFNKLPPLLFNINTLSILSIEDNNFLEALPGNYKNLKNLKILSLKGNDKLILNKDQKQWIRELENNGCKTFYDEGLFERIPEIDIDEDEIPF